MFWKRVSVGNQERVLVIRNGRFKAILAPGEHRMFVAPWVSLNLQKHRVRDLVFRSIWTDYIIEERPDLVEIFFTLVETNDVQVGIVYADGKLFQVLAPAKRVLFWRGEAKVTAEIVDVIAEPQISFGALERTVDDSLALMGVLDDDLEI